MIDRPPKKNARYSADKRAEVLAFVAEHNALHGRGGQAAAARKFLIPSVTIGAWMRQANPTPPHPWLNTLRRAATLHAELTRTAATLRQLRIEYAILRRHL